MNKTVREYINKEWTSAAEAFLKEMEKAWEINEARKEFLISKGIMPN